MKVAVVIVCYNGRKYLPATLKSVQDYAGTVDVYVVDNASSDESVPYIKKNWPNVKLLVSKHNSGFAAGNNIGIKEALSQKVDAVLLLNQDAVLTDGCVDKLTDFLFQNSRLGLVQPRVDLPNGKVNSLGNSYHYLGFGYAGGNGLNYDEALRRLSWFKNQTDIPYFSGAAVLIRSEALKKVGLFDETLFLYHEDLELGLRLRCYGWGMQVVPEAQVVHHYQFSANPQNFYYMERNRFLVWFSYFTVPTLLLLAVPLLLADLALLVMSIFSGWFGSYLKSRTYFFSPAAWGYIGNKRQQIKKNRKVSDRYILKFASSAVHFQEKDKWIVRYLLNPLSMVGWLVIKPLIRW